MTMLFIYVTFFIFLRLSNRWISVRLALIGSMINFFTGIVILLSVEKMNASLAGFCLSFVLIFTDQVKFRVMSMYR
jgi:hypothetical protein